MLDYKSTPYFVNIDPRVLLEFRRKMMNECIVEILSAEKSIAISRLHFKNAFLNLKYRYIEGSTTQIINGNAENLKT